MTLSRRSFLKIVGLTAVSVAGASMFTGCNIFSTTPITLVADKGSTDAFKKQVEDANAKKPFVYPADSSENYLKGYLGTHLSFIGLKDFEVVSFEYKKDAKDNKFLEVIVKSTKKA